MSREKNFMEFVEMVSKLEPVEYCGLCRVMCVELERDGKARPFDETLEDVLDGYLGMKRKPRRELIKMLKDATRGTPKPAMTIDRLTQTLPQMETNTAAVPSTTIMSVDITHTAAAPSGERMNGDPATTPDGTAAEYVQEGSMNGFGS